MQSALYIMGSAPFVGEIGRRWLAGMEDAI